jgi:hypothetical protein
VTAPGPGRTAEKATAACRIVILEDQLEEARRINEQLRTQGPSQSKTSA